jgi:hypothetical protein
VWPSPPASEDLRIDHRGGESRACRGPSAGAPPPAERPRRSRRGRGCSCAGAAHEAYALDRLGRVREAARAEGEARTIYESAGDWRRARALNMIGNLVFQPRRPREGLNVVGRRLAPAARSGTAWVSSSAHNLALVLWEQGDPPPPGDA